MAAPLICMWACVLVLLGASTVRAAEATSADALVEALRAAETEDEGKQLLEPHLESLKQVSPEVVETVVLRQWWSLARDMIARSHLQKADLSVAVRKGVRTLKEEADELLRTLNPKYGVAQQVSPAFQWAQNDTCIFLTVKYTVRWNAPGALEVTEPQVDMVGNVFNFSGLGKHSNNKYRYSLSLRLFDNIDPNRSVWNAASVGKMSVTLRKRWGRKWPRLLDDKKAKVGNMHVWSERQEKLDESLSSMASISNSPITCSLAGKLYCLGSDTCKEAAKCASCPGKTTPNAEDGMCAGKPNERASISFTDVDMDEGQIGGDVKITKARNEFDIDTYVFFFGKDETVKLLELGQVVPTGADSTFRIPMNTPVPAGATQVLVFSRNGHGEHETPGSLKIADAAQPKAKPSSLMMEDTSGDKGTLNGDLAIGKPSVEDSLVEKYVLHWGKSPTKRVAADSYIAEVAHSSDKDPIYKMVNRKIPDGASHVLAYTKSSHAEHPSPTSWKIVDNTRPCLNASTADCPTQVALTSDADRDAGQIALEISVAPAKDESSLEHYALKWGREQGTDVKKAGHIHDLAKGLSTHALAQDTVVPSGATHIMACSKNKYGESEHCVSAKFVDVGDNPAPEADTPAAKQGEL